MLGLSSWGLWVPHVWFKLQETRTVEVFRPQKLKKIYIFKVCPGSVYRFGQNKLERFKISAFLIFQQDLWLFTLNYFFYATLWLSILDLKHSVKKCIKLKDLSVIIRFIYMRRPVWWCHRKNSISQHFITEKLHRSKNSFTTEQEKYPIVQLYSTVW